MKIVVVHQYYLTPGQPGGSRFNEFARLWSEAGHEVTVIAGNLNYTTGTVPEKYQGHWVTEEKDGDVTVMRCHVPTTYRHSFTGRMWAFLGFTFSALTAAIKMKDPDIVIATSPPLITAIPGWAVAKLRTRGIPWIFEIRDLWPESAITTGVLRRDSLLTKLLYSLEKWACRSATKVNVLTPAFREDIVKRELIASEKIVFVPNGADVELFQPGPRDNEVRREFGWGERFVAMYAGAHGKANAVQQLLSAAEYLPDRPDLLIACVGDGPEREYLQSEARRKALTNIVFCGPQPKDRMPAFVNACDAGMAVLQNNPTFRTVYPNKVFDYMACARPTLLAIDGVARKLVCEEAQAGIFAEPENPTAIATAIKRLADSPVQSVEMGRRGREWVLANATRESLAQRYLEIMEALVKR
ncbi:MAG: glycosyltransferase family 4 protein [Acidobacteriota bacterium]